MSSSVVKYIDVSVLEAYTNYKDSGIEWLGEIPKHWNVAKLKYLSSIKTGDKDTINRKSEGKYPFFVRSPNVEQIDTYSFDGEAVLTAGDGVGVGKVFHYYKGKFDYHQRVYKISDFKDVDGKYFYYYIKENFHKEVMKISAKSTVDSLRLPMFLEFLVVFGSLQEQQAIASFLDNETFRIDLLIEKKQQFIEKLEEKRLALISNAVTKGLNPNVTMKDSEVKWIGDIPEHWDVFKLKRILDEKLKYGANESAEFEDKNAPRYIRISDFDSYGCLREDTFKSLSLDKARDYLLSDGDILFARSGATVGKTFQFMDYKGTACFAGYLIKASPNSSIICSDYLYLYTKSKSYDNWKNSIFIQATIENISADKYQYLDVPIPPLLEQQAIVDFLDKETSQIDILIEKIKQSIEYLKEYRAALINDAVTGKIDVRGKVCAKAI